MVVIDAFSGIYAGNALETAVVSLMGNRDSGEIAVEAGDVQLVNVIQGGAVGIDLEVSTVAGNAGWIRTICFRRSDSLQASGVIALSVIRAASATVESSAGAITDHSATKRPLLRRACVCQRTPISAAATGRYRSGR